MKNKIYKTIYEVQKQGKFYYPVVYTILDVDILPISEDPNEWDRGIMEGLGESCARILAHSEVLVEGTVLGKSDGTFKTTIKIDHHEITS